MLLKKRPVLMVLGAGKLQVNAIKRAEELGYAVLAVDYNETSVGKEYSTYQGLASTFDYDACLKLAREYAIDGIMTVGTDQPVLIAAQIAEALDLPFYISSDVAKAVTNKKYMKEIFIDHDIPCVQSVIYRGDDAVLKDLKEPLVLKPVDSQGQRGIFLVEEKFHVKDKFHESLSFSREDYILVEEYYEHTEITVSGWVSKGQTYILSITDRVTFDELSKLGICISHEYPTYQQKTVQKEAVSLTEKIVSAFGIKEGPIYFQMLVGDEGVKVNEIACRIGGAYEDYFMPVVTGVDLLKMNIDYCMGNSVDISPFKEHDFFSSPYCLSAQLFFANPGKIDKIIGLDDLLNKDHVITAGINFHEGQIIPETENATQRAGYFVTYAKDENLLISQLNEGFDTLKFMSNGENLVIRGKRGYR